MAATLQPEDMSRTTNGGDDGESPAKWKHLSTLLSREGAYSDSSEFIPGDAPIINLKNARILVIGAGGLGCEILKNLALSGFRNLDVIDMDTIDVSNLNRQFLFREKDVGQPKASVAADFVMKRCPGCKVTPYVGKIQDKDEDYYMQFNIVICGLDSIEARRWINATLVARYARPARRCTPLHPRHHSPAPQHCIEWAHILKWEEERKDDVLDTDDPEHITWLYQKALSRAREFNIPGVTYSLTQGVVKNIIPAIASTNAIVAASCCNEAFKIATSSAPYLGYPGTNNYMLYTGDSGVYTYTFEHQKKADCPVCGNRPKAITLDPDSTLGEFVESLAERPESQLKKPNLRTADKSLYYSTPASLEESTRPNLKRKLADLLEDGEVMAISDPAFQINFQYIAHFS
ncbi:NEDD8 activating enzyme [Friedmanniomyces endolithicus]|nr:NEDD8 activating enzyme [Friedmanniomyces endolithicus]